MGAVRFDTSSWLPGAVLFGDDGFGVIGSLIPLTGTNGGGYAANDISSPADDNKEICGRITSYPSAGIFNAGENTAFDFSGAPDGTYTALYQLYVDGVATGSPATITLSVGSGTAVNPGAGTLTITGYAPTVVQSASQIVSPGVGALTITGYAPTVVQSGSQYVSPGAGTLSITGYAPTVAQSANQSVSPAPGTLTITGYAPTIAQSGGIAINSGAGSLTITGYAPTVSQSGAALLPNARFLSAGVWRRVRLSAGLS